MLTYLQARRMFSYDPLTGELRRHYNGQRAGYENFKRGRPANRKVRIGNGQRANEATIIWLWMTGSLPAHEIDHIDLNPFNNKWVNLREASDTENAHNRRKYGNSQFKWVQEVNGRYRARVCANGVRICSTYYDTPQEAHAAALTLASKIHGKFARSQ